MTKRKRNSAVPPETVREAVRLVQTTSATEFEARRGAMGVLEAANSRCTPEEYIAFYTPGLTLAPAEVAAAIRRQPILFFYEAAFDKVRREVGETVVPPGRAALWHVYNMGYVVKTARHCFAVDLHHRRAEELIPMLDFLLVTHNHNDHFTTRLLEAFRESGKPIVSNFFPHRGYSAEEQTIAMADDLLIRTARTDHGDMLRYFTQTFEVELAEGEGKLVIFTGGDSSDPTQFRMRNPAVDCFIVHPRIRLKVAEAQKIVHPKLTLISHLQELHHPVDQWRWSYAVGEEELQSSRRRGCECCVPLWGDRIEIAAAGASPSAR